MGGEGRGELAAVADSMLQQKWGDSSASPFAALRVSVRMMAVICGLFTFMSLVDAGQLAVVEGVAGELF